MKTIIGIFLLATTFVFSSCTGPMGPPGYDGYDGLDGINGKDGDSFVGSIFEITGDFTFDNDHKLYFEFPTDFEIYDTDVVLVYILWELAETDGGTLDVWRLLPQTVILPEGILQYNFDYTVADVQVFLDGDLDFNTLLPEEWKDQIFRIAVLPAGFANKETVDVTDFNSIIKSPQLKLNTVEKINLNEKILK